MQEKGTASAKNRKYIYDGLGNKVYLKSGPDEREIAAVRIQDTYSTYPADGLTPAKLAAILKEADGGNVYRQMELFEDIEERNSRIFACLQTRKQAVIGLPWDVLPADESEKAIKIAAFVKEKIKEIDNFDEAQLDLLDAIGKGYGIVEIIWQVKKRQNVIALLEWRHQKKFTWDNEQRELRLLTEESPSEGIPLSSYPAKFVIHTYKGRSGFPARRGILRTLAWLHLFMQFSLKDWARFCEAYVMPIRLGKYDASASIDDRNALKTAIQAMGADGAGIISKNTEIEFVNAIQGAANSEVYNIFIEMLKREIAIVVLGQNLTTEVMQGSRAAATVHEKVRQDIVQGDCVTLDRTINRQIVQPLTIFNFGLQEKYPQYITAYQPPEDRLTETQVDKALTVDMGLPIDNDYLYRKYNVPQPGGEGEKRLLKKENQKGKPLDLPPSFGKMEKRIIGEGANKGNG